MSHRIPIACVVRLGEGDLAGLAVHIGDTSRALNAKAALAELIAAAPKPFSTAIPIPDTSAPAASQILIRPSSAQPLAEVVDNQDLVALGQEALANDDRVLLCLVKE